MRSLKSNLISEIEFYKELLNEANSELKHYVKKSANHQDEANSHIQVDNRKGHPQYYFVTKDSQTGRTIRKFVKKDRMETAGDLVRKKYYEKTVKVLNQQLAVLQKCVQQYDEDAVLQVYEHIHSAKQRLIRPVILPDEQYAAEWQSCTYVSKPFSEGASVFITERGEQVRSKSEVFIADKLFFHEHSISV